MKELHLLAVLAVLASASLAAPAPAPLHGAKYPNVPPPDVDDPQFPPGMFGGGTRGINSPKTPPGGRPNPGMGPAGGGLPRPTGPGGVAPGGSGRPTLPGQEFDRESWEHWWNYNKAPYLDLRARMYEQAPVTGDDDWAGRADSLTPTAQDRYEVAAPALLEALGERAVDIRTGALMALAKIGRNAEPELARRIADAITPLLEEGNQEIAETAAVALGVLGRAEALPTLLALSSDDATGRKLCGRTEVPYRTRAFALYGLGMVARRSESNAVRQTIAEHLVGVLEAPNFATRDVKVAAVSALGLAPLQFEVAVPPRATGQTPGPQAKHVLSRRTQVAYLLEFVQADRATAPRRPDRVRAHAVVALGRLLDGTPETLRSSALAVLTGLVARRSGEDPEVQEAVLLALGEVADADGDPVDVAAREALVRHLESGRAVARRYASVALARAGSRPGTGEEPLAGSAQARHALLVRLTRGPSRLEPWAGLALGILGAHLNDAGIVPDPACSERLRDVLAGCKRPQDVGAYALAVGLRRDLAARETLLAQMEAIADPLARGYVIVGLGLLGSRKDIPAIAEVLESSRYKPELLWQSAVGLALLGDKAVVPGLLALLERANGLSSQAAIASALGLVGDRRSVEVLVEMMRNDEDLTDTARAFAAVALGLVCAEDRLPWNQPLRQGVHYLAVTTTLTSDGVGILDIL